MTDLTRRLRQTVSSSGLDSRSQLMALALAARDLLSASGELPVPQKQEAAP